VKNWDDIETRKEYLIGMGFSPTEVENKGREWVLMMTSQY
jgi:hypothetical protein